MKDLKSLLIAVLGVVIFIAILPALMWIFLFIFVLVVIVIIYFHFKLNKLRKGMTETFEQQIYEDTNYHQTKESDDVIDVEYSEREEK